MVTLIDGPRYVYKFATHDDALAYEFPLYEYEWDSEQTFRYGSVNLIGANYQHDSLGFARAPKNNAREAIRALALPDSWAEYDTEFDNAKGTMERIGIGKLYSVDASNVQRWSWARCVAMPRATVGGSKGRVLPLIFEFERQSDWFDLSFHQGSVPLSATPTLFDIENPGNTIARNIVFRLRSNSATGFTNPIIRNLTTGYEISSARDAVSDLSEIRIITEQYRVQFSNTDGVSYTDDYANVTTPDTQVGLMALAPGTNNMEYVNTGTPDAVLEYSFLPAYA